MKGAKQRESESAIAFICLSAYEHFPFCCTDPQCTQSHPNSITAGSSCRSAAPPGCCWPGR